MKHIIAIAMTVLMCLSSLTPALAQSPTPGDYVVNKPVVNVREGPGLQYRVVGKVYEGQHIQVVGENDGWYQVIYQDQHRWIYAPLLSPSPAISAPSLPPMQDVVVLGPETQYPVRARKFIGWGYEIVDNSSQYDIVMHRDVLGFVAHQVWENTLYKIHPNGVRYTLIAAVPSEECMTEVADQQGNIIGIYRPVLAPIPMINLRGKACLDNRLGFGYGDGAGGKIYAKCAYDDRDSPAVAYYDPEECFLAIGQASPNTTSLFVTLLFQAYRPQRSYSFVTGEITEYNPDYDKPPYSPHLGQAHKDEATGQWLWDNPFLEIVPER